MKNLLIFFVLKNGNKNVYHCEFGTGTDYAYHPQDGKHRPSSSRRMVSIVRGG
jgi:hypothetical protein